MAAISELVRDGLSRAPTRWRKRRLRTRAGSDYLALELADPSGRIEGRVWHDVDLLDSRFAEGDAVGCWPRRALSQPAPARRACDRGGRGCRPGRPMPSLRRDADELEGFLDFLAGEIAHAGLGPSSRRSSAMRRFGVASARRRRPRRGITSTRAVCSSTQSGSPRSAGSSHNSTLVCARPPARGRAAARRRSNARAVPGPGFQVTEEGRC